MRFNYFYSLFFFRGKTYSLTFYFFVNFILDKSKTLFTDVYFLLATSFITKI